MDNLDDLKLRIERIISEVKDIIKLFEMEIADPRKAVSFRQVKEIEASIERLKRQGLPVPEELKQLKQKLFSTYEIHKEFRSLYNEFLGSIHGLTASDTSQKLARTIREPKTGRSSYRKPPNYEKPLGSKGNSNLEDYLIPVIKLMWNGHNHREAFRQIAKKLDVRYNTVSAQCTRALGLTTDEFINQVKSKTVVDLIEKKYQDQYHVIKTQLK
jgi:hypothetical protein